MIRLFICGCLMVILPFIKVYPQEYVPFTTDSAVWNLHFISSLGGFDVMFHSCSKVTVAGDTLSDGKRYSKIYDSHISNEPFALIREDSSKKIYIKPSVHYYTYTVIDTAEFVMYDFNLLLNDTVTVFLISIENNYARFLPYELFVENVDSVWSTTGYRKRYRMLPVTGTIWGGCDGENYWIEGIGSTVAPLYTYLGEGSCFENHHALHNFMIGNEFIYGENTDCNLVYSIDKENNDLEILKIIPNPVVNISKVIWNINNVIMVHYEIIDLIGRKIISKSINSNYSCININRNEFPPGIYSLSVTDSNENKYYSKFIIQ